MAEVAHAHRVPALLTRRLPARATNQSGTRAVRAIFANVQLPVTYSRSIARNADARASVAAGAGNQNMLVATATTVSPRPHALLRYAK